MRVLVADDDAVSRRMLAGLLARHGFQVIEAQDGLQAWDLLVRQEPAVAVLDWDMPGWDGLELCRRIRRHDRILNTPVLLLTSRERRRDRHRGIAAGANHYLVKPFDKDEILNLLRNLEKKVPRRGAPS